MPSLSLFIADEAAMLNLGARLAHVTDGRGSIYLYGDLGAGKTTLSRGLVQGLGHRGRVKSPTFTLVEPYEIGAQRVFHFDLYRLTDPDELEFMGVRDYFQEDALCLVEWPERGEGLLPKANLNITISPQNSGRLLCLSPSDARGEAWCAALANGDT